MTLVMRVVIPFVASVLLVVVGMVIMQDSTGDMSTFGWLLLIVGVLGVAINTALWARSRL